MAFEEAKMMAKALGFPYNDIALAMLEIRNFRLNCLRQNLDPRAIRIAILFGIKGDLHYARKELSERELQALDDIAESFFQVSIKEKEPHG